MRINYSNIHSATILTDDDDTISMSVDTDIGQASLRFGETHLSVKIETANLIYDALGVLLGRQGAN